MEIENGGKATFQYGGETTLQQGDIVTFCPASNGLLIVRPTLNPGQSIRWSITGDNKLTILGDMNNIRLYALMVFIREITGMSFRKTDYLNGYKGADQYIIE
ncbi:MAG: hypothetical protein QG620_713 [Patescibacteria group bacterium]|nr:hypothetical protein [Patescibacteria group bacterium]